ncbi:uncharacterized protein F5147DRAFT_836398 [Suillus discolor]|uniref:Uncharacterized protein n=1 Tax=Suillus discolor TaxID=1912936 RepID=A0A9P7JVB3_9AGAM|nr:uncharacterized protein F5147DRAFT_836398 [Suillus discolor]KAG2110407.1 hypothetical protein F5147DRAFT_836398 [Suillus discolor]
MRLTRMTSTKMEMRREMRMRMGMEHLCANTSSLPCYLLMALVSLALYGGFSSSLVLHGSSLAPPWSSLVSPWPSSFLVPPWSFLVPSWFFSSLVLHDSSLAFSCSISLLP